MKAVKRYPAGTADRWKVIGDTIGKNAKESIGKAKEIQEKQQQDIEDRRQHEQDQKDKIVRIKKEQKEKEAELRKA
jgi:hypothetical protein